jgi:2'-5' RNA ligase
MRCFIAIDIDNNEILRKICEIRDKLISVDYENILKPVEEKNMHITLKFLGNVDGITLKNIIEILKNIEFPRFKILLKNIDFFPNERFVRVIYIQCYSKELDSLAEIINNKLCDIGFKKEDFKGHLTITRVKGKLNKEMLNIIKDVKEVYIGEMVVDKVKLKQSTLTPKGPIYQDIIKVDLQ